MGWDFANHQIFAGSETLGLRPRVLDHLDGFMAERGYTVVNSWDNACRTLAIGPAQRWLCLYDSCGTGDDVDSEEFEALSVRLSELAPLVDIHMDDSTAVHFYLLRAGQVADRYGNIYSIFPQWPSKEVEDAHRGRPELWTDLLMDSMSEADLRRAWQGANTTEIMSRTAAVLGWDPKLCEAGYTVDYEGIPEYYRDHFTDAPFEVDLSGFVEKYYWREETADHEQSLR